jgi:hypothetical protein
MRADHWNGRPDGKTKSDIKHYLSFRAVFGKGFLGCIITLSLNGCDAQRIL